MIVEIVSEEGVIVARQAGRDAAREVGMGMADQTRVATAISELVRNVLVHGGGHGQCTVEAARTGSIAEVKIVVTDEGPGIPDIELALQDGFSTQKSLGAGLPGTRRLSDRFEITSRPGETTVRAAIVRELF